MENKTQEELLQSADEWSLRNFRKENNITIF